MYSSDLVVILLLFATQIFADVDTPPASMNSTQVTLGKVYHAATNALDINLEPGGGIVTFQRTVTTGGTAVVLSDDTEVISVLITAKSGNSGDIFIGGNDSVSGDTGIILAAGNSILVDVDNFNKLFVNSQNDNDGVSFLGLLK